MLRMKIRTVVGTKTFVGIVVVKIIGSRVVTGMVTVMGIGENNSVGPPTQIRTWMPNEKRKKMSDFERPLESERTAM